MPGGEEREKEVKGRGETASNRIHIESCHWFSVLQSMDYETMLLSGIQLWGNQCG